jgi:ABC-type phosphate transport system substrate-binding protein
MSAFEQKTRSLDIRAGILAGASAAALAVFGLGAGSAMATPTCVTGTIAGQGSSLQKIAQQNVWNKKYNEACGAGHIAVYNPSGSGAGLKAMGYLGGSIAFEESQYGGTDEAPEKPQIEVSDGLSKTNAVIVPVSQTAIAAVIHPPANCQFEEETGITWKDLNKVFGGKTITSWSQFENIEATVSGACNSPITRVVREDGSGTTYQFKNYLSTLEKPVAEGGEAAETPPCAPITGGTTWASLRKNNGKTKAEGNPNLNWPECSGGSSVVRASGGGGVAGKVASTAGTIGYAALPDAKAASDTLALLQNGKTGALPRFSAPDNTTSKTARCTNSRYTIPSNASTGLDVDWSNSFGAVPAIGGEEYPLCTLTFDLGFHEATKAKYTAAQAALAAAYIKYEVAEGQTDLVGNWYSALPSNVQTAATTAASKLG